MTGLRDAPFAETTILALGDQPFLTPTAVFDLLSAHLENGAGRITIPFVGGRRDNPIVIPRALRVRMLRYPVNLGCRKLTRDHPALVHRFDTHRRSFTDDIDTPQDLARAKSHRLLETCNGAHQMISE